MLVGSGQTDVRVVFFRKFSQEVFYFDWKDVCTRTVVLEDFLFCFSPCTFLMNDYRVSQSKSLGKR